MAAFPATLPRLLRDALELLALAAFVTFIGEIAILFGAGGSL